MSESYTKLFSSITESTVWAESSNTRIVWITMLAMADRRGRVWAAIPGLANRARVPIADCETALKAFLRPDPYSRTKDHDGRRIAEIDGGWVLLNHAKFRALQAEADKREADAERQRQKRANGPRGTVAKVAGSRGLSQVVAEVAQADADTEADTSKEKEKKRAREKKTPETPLPENFAVSERVRAWAERKGFGGLDIHLENFIGQCRAKGYTYADWDEGFMNAIRKDWAEVRSGRNGSTANRKLSLAEETELGLQRFAERQTADG